MQINVATKITILRILLIPIIFIVLAVCDDKSIINLGIMEVHAPYFYAFLIYVIASLSDAVDGHIARKTNTITNLGKFLDPIADKLLVNSILIYFVYTGHIPVWATILMVARDTIVDALRMICVENNIVIAASKWGKVKTVFQMVSIGLIFIFANPNVELANWLLYLVYLTTFASVASGVDYIIKNYKQVFK
ncbi:MAG: CDP-diacylglycerol--glycerol-3-phosphate 3-phosphatidyltransferase [Erysipelotrichales bacterium]